jgi:hypothetical protein
MRRRAVWLAIGLAATGGIIALARLLLEPAYHGANLSEWLQRYNVCVPRNSPFPFPATAPPGIHYAHLYSPSTVPKAPRSEDPEANAAADAVRAMHSRALPFLVDWISLRPSPLKARLRRLTYKLLPFLRNNTVTQWLLAEHGYDEIDLALSGFVILGSNAVSAVPALEKLAADPTAPGSTVAIRALLEIGPSAAPSLASLLAGKHPFHIREEIRIQLGRIGPAACGAVPPLARDLTNADQTVAARSATALGGIGRRPEIAVPALLAALNEPRRMVRECAASALRNYGDSARPAVPKLQSLLHDSPFVGEEARRTLARIAPEFLSNAAGPQTNSLVSPSQ